jgi:phenylpropionate dioxygenase-like ring-hydroxylating dioxygenase large terminal subunit
MNQHPRNQWYVAAWRHEVGRRLLARTICDEPVLLYRTRGGQAVALSDRCVHRRLPLSLGKLVGDDVECGYHGFTYNCSGVCVSVPGQDRIPRSARVTTYPVEERDGLVWIWIGDPAAAVPASIPACPWLDDAGWAAVGEVTYSPFRTGLLLDNLMDLSHETYLHAGLIGTPEVAATPITWHVEPDKPVVRVSRHMSGAECPPFYSKTTGMPSPVDRWQDIEYTAPALWVNHARIAPAGVAPGADGSDPRGAHAKIIHLLTPETATTCWDFWAVARDFALEDQGVSDFLLKMNQEVVQQDLDALTELEKVVARESPDAQELSIGIDGGGLAAREVYAKLVAGS